MVSQLLEATRSSCLTSQSLRRSRPSPLPSPVSLLTLSSFIARSGSVPWLEETPGTSYLILLSSTQRLGSSEPSILLDLLSFALFFPSHWFLFPFVPSGSALLYVVLPLLKEFRSLALVLFFSVLLLRCSFTICRCLPFSSSPSSHVGKTVRTQERTRQTKLNPNVAESYTTRTKRHQN